MTHDPIRDTEHARAGGVEDGLGVSGLDGGGDVGNVVREEAAGGRAALAVSRVVGGAGEARLAREEAEDVTRQKSRIYSLDGHTRAGVFRPEFTYGSQGAPAERTTFTDNALREEGRPFGRTRCGAELPRANLQEWDADAPRQCLQSL